MWPRRAYRRIKAPLFGEQPLDQLTLGRMRHCHRLRTVHLVCRHLAQVQLEARRHRRRLRLVVALAAAVIRLGCGAFATRLKSSRRRARLRRAALQGGAVGLIARRRHHQGLLIDGGVVVAATLHAKYRRRERDDVHGRRLVGSPQLRRREITSACGVLSGRPRGERRGTTLGEVINRVLALS